MADEPVNLVLELLREMRSDAARLDAKIDSKFDQLDAKIDRVDHKVDRVDQKVDSKFDHLDAKIDRVDHKVDSVIKQMIDLQHDVSMLRHAIAPGEMEAANRDIAQFRREMDGVHARLEVLEKQHRG